MLGLEPIWRTPYVARSCHRISTRTGHLPLRPTHYNIRRPASRSAIKIMPVVLIGLSLLADVGLIPQAKAFNQNDAITSALGWLSAHQQPNGSYGGFTEPQTAPAAHALWIRFQNSPSVLLSYNWLKNQLQNSTTWFWGGGGNLKEADVPGEILYSFVQSNNLALLNKLSQVTINLTKFQQSNGGFLGYYDTPSGKQVTSSVDTAMALLGLIGANGISLSNMTSATNYLLTLQNPSGSFNLTRTLSSNSLYSLGPEPVSITALVVLALRAASFSVTESHVASALNYLSNAASSNFAGHVYAAALSLVVFAGISDATDGSLAVSFLLAQQNTDGGFRDVIRSSTNSNALDTGWVAVALQLGGALCCVGFGGLGGGRRYVM